MKFKVGDKVRLKEGLTIGQRYGRIEYLDVHNNFLGKELTISTFHSDLEYYSLSNGLCVSEEMIYPSFNIGDWILISLNSPVYPREIGVVIEIDHRPSICHYLIGTLEGGQNYWIEDKYLSKYVSVSELTACAKTTIQETPFDFSDCVSTAGIQVQYRADCCCGKASDTLTRKEPSIISVNPSKVKLYMI